MELSQVLCGTESPHSTQPPDSVNENKHTTKLLTAGGGAGCHVSKIILVPAGDQGKCFHEGKYFLKPDMGAFLFLPRVMKCEVRLSMSGGCGERRS